MAGPFDWLTGPRNSLLDGAPMYQGGPQASAATDRFVAAPNRLLDYARRAVDPQTPDERMAANVVRGFTESPAMVGPSRAVSVLDNGTILGEGADVGRVKIDRSGPAVRIADIAIDPSSQRQGYGSSVIRQIQEQAAADGLPVVLTTDAMRGKAAQAGQRRLYEGLGFVRNTGPDRVGHRIGRSFVAEEYVWRPPARAQE